MYVIKNPFRLLVAGALLLSSAVFVACNENSTPTAQPRTITDIVQTDSRFTILRAAVIKAGLADALRAGSLTVFAPTDDAFRNAGIQNVDNLTAAQLTPILQYHVLNSRVPSANINTANNTPVQTLLSGPNGIVYVTKTSAGGVSVNGRTVTTADVAADNGVIHVIDGVLMPPAADLVTSVLGDPQNFSLLAAAVQRAGAGVVTALSSLTAGTVFAPTNQAFISAGLSATAIAAADPALLTRVLSYHVVPGRVFSTQLSNNLTTGTLLGATPVLTFGVTGNAVTVRGAGNGTNASNVTRANILTTNAVVHQIDRVLLPGS